MTSSTVIGLTGSIGSGKSTVLKYFGELGASIISTDKIAKELTAKESVAYKKIVATFGAAILSSDGAIDRKKLAKIAFGSRAAKEKLEAILHPLIKSETEKRIAAFKNKSQSPIVVEVPLLFESGWEGLFDSIIAIKCGERAALARHLAGKHKNVADFQSRAEAQMTEDEKIALADHIIDNSFDLKHLKSQVESLFKKLS